MRRALWCPAAPFDTNQPTSLEMCRPAPTSMNIPPTASSTFSKTSCSKEQLSGTDTAVSLDYQMPFVVVSCSIGADSGADTL